MTTIFKLGTKKLFPCPVCMEPLEVRHSKKGKPYITCNRCGVQLFVRVQAGIAVFNQLVERAESEDLWTRLTKLDERFRLQCGKCGRRFWIEEKLVETSWVDGGFRGFRCPNEGCAEIVPWRKQS